MENAWIKNLKRNGNVSKAETNMTRGREKDKHIEALVFFRLINSYLQKEKKNLSRDGR
jgi:hypothetical protein